MDRLLSEKELLKHFDPREDWVVVQTIKAIQSADIIDDIKTEISMYENHDESADEMVQGIKSILSLIPNKRVTITSAEPQDTDGDDYKYIKEISKPTGIEFDEEQEQIDFVPSYKSIPCKIKVQAGVSDTNIGKEDIDIEIRNLVRYLNMVDGIETIESCFGHNEAPCFIWFKANSINAINNLIFNIFNNDRLWKIEINNQDFHSDYKDLRFVLSSGEIKDFPTVNLMVDNLTYRLEKWLTERKR